MHTRENIDIHIYICVCCLLHSSNHVDSIADDLELRTELKKACKKWHVKPTGSSQDLINGILLEWMQSAHMVDLLHFPRADNKDPR